MTVRQRTRHQVLLQLSPYPDSHGDKPGRNGKQWTRPPDLPSGTAGPAAHRTGGAHLTAMAVPSVRLCQHLETTASSETIRRAASFADDITSGAIAAPRVNEAASIA